MNVSILFFSVQVKPLQTQTQDLVKAFVAKVTEVGDELKAKNPELFSGDTKKLQVSLSCTYFLAMERKTQF